VTNSKVFAWIPREGGVNRFRVLEPLRAYTAAGGTATWSKALNDAGDADTILAHSLNTEQGTAGWHELADAGIHRLILDIDDLMWAPDWDVFKKSWDPATLDRLQSNITRAHVVTTTTPRLAQRIREWTGHPNIHVCPNTVPAWLLARPMPEPYLQTVGWQGSSSHKNDIGSTIRNLERFLAGHPDWKFRHYGHTQPPQPQVESFPWNNSLDEYWQTVSMQLGIGPLRDTEFNRCKSPLRAVEYAALGIVAVLPACPTYDGWVHDGQTGVLIKPHQTLRGVLAGLAADPQACLKMAAAAREWAANWTTEANLSTWLKAWGSA